MVVRIILIALLLITFFGFIVLALIWRQLSKYLEQRRLRQLSQMHSYNRRLKLIVSELLAKANDIDQESKYISQTPDHNWSQRLLASCSDLVVLGNSLHLIEHKLGEGNVKESRESILSSCRIAVRVSTELDGLESSWRYRVPAGENPTILPAADYKLTQGKEKTS